MAVEEEERYHSCLLALVVLGLRSFYPENHIFIQIKVQNPAILSERSNFFVKISPQKLKN